jgi:hypothetical protein
MARPAKPLHDNSLGALRPWYRQPWLWFLLSIPIASVILSSIMITLAVNSRDTLVNDRYHKDGLALNRLLDADQQADHLGIRPILSISDDGHVALDFSAPLNEPSIILDLIHPTLGERDTEIRLLPSSQGYTGLVNEPLAPGRWIVELYAHDRSWRIREQIILPAHRIALHRD